jgi:hypothetical protein
VKPSLLRPSPARPDREPIRKCRQSRFGTDARDAFLLLAAIGRECLGAAQPLPEGEDPSDVEKIAAEPLDNTAVEQALIRPRHGSAVAKQAGLGDADALIHEILTLVPSPSPPSAPSSRKNSPLPSAQKFPAGIERQAYVFAPG